MRVCDGNGEWGSVYRKLVIFVTNSELIPLKGYRHSLNGTDLGYEEVENQPDGKYTFTVDLPDGAGFNMADAPIIFDGDNLAVSHSETIDYRIQIESELGWAPPSSYSFDADVNFSTTAETMEVPSSITFSRPGATEFKAVKFASSGAPLYVRANRAAMMDIYRDGAKVLSISPDDLTVSNAITLDAGTYYGVVYNVAKDDASDEVVLTIDDRNLSDVSISYDGRYITLYSPDEGVGIFYTLDGSNPMDGASYEGAFDLQGLRTVRAIAKKGETSISGISEYVANVYSDDSHALTAAPGVLSSAFAWDESFPASVAEYTIEGPLNGDDFTFIRGMESLRFLNIEKVVADILPDRALEGMNLVSISLPEGKNLRHRWQPRQGCRCQGRRDIPCRQPQPRGLPDRKHEALRQRLTLSQENDPYHCPGSRSIGPGQFLIYHDET